MAATGGAQGSHLSADVFRIVRRYEQVCPSLIVVLVLPQTDRSVVAGAVEPERGSCALLCATGSVQAAYLRRAAVLGLGNSPVPLCGRRASAAGHRCNVPRCASQPRLSALLWCGRAVPDLRRSHQSRPADAHRSPAHHQNALTHLCILGRTWPSPRRCARDARAVNLFIECIVCVDLLNSCLVSI